LLNEDYEVVKLLRRTSKPVFHLVNKIDGPEREDTLLAPFYELGVDELWPMSAEHGFGVADFFDFLTATMPTEPETDHSLPDTTIRVSCIGRPNVGKSSLVNRLLGQERMVVSAIPGTTRDAVDTLLEQNGKHYLLIDTAGIRRKGKVSHKLEKFSVMRALSSLEKCDIALLLIDAEEGITEQDTKVIGYALERGRACLVLLNKWDLIREDKKKQKWLLDEVEMATRFVGFAPTLPISALSGFGVKKILPTLDEVYRQYALEFTTNKINKDDYCHY
jgi:GTP-binding protein